MLEKGQWAWLGHAVCFVALCFLCETWAIFLVFLVPLSAFGLVVCWVSLQFESVLLFGWRVEEAAYLDEVRDDSGRVVRVKLRLPQVPGVGTVDKWIVSMHESQRPIRTVHISKDLQRCIDERPLDRCGCGGSILCKLVDAILSSFFSVLFGSLAVIGLALPILALHGNDHNTSSSSDDGSVYFCDYRRCCDPLTYVVYYVWFVVGMLQILLWMKRGGSANRANYPSTEEFEMVRSADDTLHASKEETINEADSRSITQTSSSGYLSVISSDPDASFDAESHSPIC